MREFLFQSCGAWKEGEKLGGGSWKSRDRGWREKKITEDVKWVDKRLGEGWGSLWRGLLTGIKVIKVRV